MKYELFNAGDVKSEVRERLRAMEHDHFQYSVAFEIAEAEKDVKKMLDLFLAIQRLEPSIKSLHAQLQ